VANQRMWLYLLAILTLLLRRYVDIVYRDILVEKGEENHENAEENRKVSLCIYFYLFYFFLWRD
jgi:hypothetical protein